MTADPRTKRETGRGRRDRGFTLIEVLVAFTILTLSLTALLHSFSQSTRTSVIAARYAEATTVAENALAIAVAQSPIEFGVADGVAANGMRWRVEAAPHLVDRVASEDEESLEEDRLFQLVRVSVAVRFDESLATAGRSVRLSTIRLEPVFDE